MSLTTRQHLTRQLNQLTEQTLPKLAKERGYPVHLDHCFKRIVYDASMGAKWDTKVKAPFCRNAPLGQLMVAIAIAQGIVDQGLDIHALNNLSLAYRGKKQKPLAST